MKKKEEKKLKGIIKPFHLSSIFCPVRQVHVHEDNLQNLGEPEKTHTDFSHNTRQTHITNLPPKIQINSCLIQHI